MATEEPVANMQPLSRRRLWLFRALAALIVFGCLEFTAFVGLRMLNNRYPMAPMADITPEHVSSFLEKRYDPDLGWHALESFLNKQGVRSDHEYDDFSNAISVYGDSYTFCDGVTVEESWPMQLEALMGCGVMNFGVGGYGTDQAMMRLEKTYADAPVPTVLLCVQVENINRCVNIYRGFYQTGFSPPKPRYLLDGDGLRVYNPFNTPDAVRDMLLDHPEKLVAEARKYDYWCQRELVFGEPWSLHFPYTFQMAMRLPFIMNRVHIGTSNLASHVPLFETDSEGYQVLTRIIRRFRQFGAQQGFRALIVVFPTPRDIFRMAETGERPYQSLNDFLDKEAIPYVDLLKPLSDHPDPPSLMVNRKDHISAAGGAIVAEEILKFLEAQDAIPPACTAMAGDDGPK